MKINDEFIAIPDAAPVKDSTPHNESNATNGTAEAIERFFTVLAERQNGRENDLSDLTWAMCQASDAFKAAFVRFFFPTLDPDTVESIDREVATDGARPDFALTCKDGTQYLVEVKIWNRNQHFGQYEEAFGIPSDRLGYIVNYALHVEGYTVHTWEVFYKYLADKAPADERDVWAGYRAYVKTTCWIFDRTTPIRPHDEDFEDAFTQLIARAISRVSDEKVECELYGNRSRNLITGDNIGREFHFRRTDGTVGDTRGSFVVYDYDKDMPAVYIAFKSHDNWGGPFTRHFDTDEKAATLNRDHVNAYWEGGALWVELDPAEFFACPTIEGQEEILRRFLRDVVTTLVDA